MVLKATIISSQYIELQEITAPYTTHIFKVSFTLQILLKLILAA